MLAKYFSIIRNYVLSVSAQRKYNFYHQNTLIDAFRPNSRNVIGRNPLMVIPLLANQDLTPMLACLYLYICLLLCSMLVEEPLFVLNETSRSKFLYFAGGLTYVSLFNF